MTVNTKIFGMTEDRFMEISEMETTEKKNLTKEELRSIALIGMSYLLKNMGNDTIFFLIQIMNELTGLNIETPLEYIEYLDKNIQDTDKLVEITNLTLKYQKMIKDEKRG